MEEGHLSQTAWSLYHYVHILLLGYWVYLGCNSCYKLNFVTSCRLYKILQFPQLSPFDGPNRGKNNKKFTFQSVCYATVTASVAHQRSVLSAILFFIDLVIHLSTAVPRDFSRYCILSLFVCLIHSHFRWLVFLFYKLVIVSDFSISVLTYLMSHRGSREWLFVLGTLTQFKMADSWDVALCVLW
jgi:hypothetical protein